MRKRDSRLRGHYNSQPYFKDTSAAIQNELLECMFSVYQEVVAKQVSDAPFVAVQVDKTMGLSYKSQTVIVLLYMTGISLVKKRLWRFSEVMDKTTSGQ